MEPRDVCMQVNMNGIISSEWESIISQKDIINRVYDFENLPEWGHQASGCHEDKRHDAIIDFLFGFKLWHQVQPHLWVHWKKCMSCKVGMEIELSLIWYMDQRSSHWVGGNFAQQFICTQLTMRTKWQNILWQCIKKEQKLRCNNKEEIKEAVTSNWEWRVGKRNKKQEWRNETTVAQKTVPMFSHFVMFSL